MKGSGLPRRHLLAGGLAAPFLGSLGLSPRAAPAYARAAGGPPEGYRLAFADEFEDVDLGRITEEGTAGRPGAPAWRSRYRHPRKDVINGEKQIYMDAAFGGTAGRSLGVQPFRIVDGALEIRAEPADPQRVRPFIWNQGFTSGCISTERSHAQRYGYFEVRARMPAGRGFWPALWLLPTSGAWPPEIDIVEISGARPRSLWTNVHAHGNPNPPADPSLPGPGRWHEAGADVTEAFHVYAAEWTPDAITFFFDGAPISRRLDHGIHEEMYFLANLAVGSKDPNWIPDPDASTPFPGVFAIDYVRIYARA